MKFLCPYVQKVYCPSHQTTLKFKSLPPIYTGSDRGFDGTRIRVRSHTGIYQWSRQRTGSQYKCVEYLLRARAPFWFMNKFINYIAFWTSLFATLVKAGSQYDVTACVALRCFRCIVYVTLRCVLLVHNFASLRYASGSFGDRSVEWRAIATAKMSWSRFYYSHCISGEGGDVKKRDLFGCALYSLNVGNREITIIFFKRCDYQTLNPILDT